MLRAGSGGERGRQPIAGDLSYCELMLCLVVHGVDLRGISNCQLVDILATELQPREATPVSDRIALSRKSLSIEGNLHFFSRFYKKLSDIGNATAASSGA